MCGNKPYNPLDVHWKTFASVAATATGASLIGKNSNRVWVRFNALDTAGLGAAGNVVNIMVSFGGVLRPVASICNATPMVELTLEKHGNLVFEEFFAAESNGVGIPIFPSEGYLSTAKRV